MVIEGGLTLIANGGHLVPRIRRSKRDSIRSAITPIVAYYSRRIRPRESRICEGGVRKNLHRQGFSISHACYRHNLPWMDTLAQIRRREREDDSGNAFHLLNTPRDSLKHFSPSLMFKRKHPLSRVYNETGDEQACACARV